MTGPTGSEAPRNVGTKTRLIVLPPRFPDADAIAQARAASTRQSGVDVLLVNPPSPDGAVWIRSQHRVGRRSRENMIWPQVSLAQLAALLSPTYTVRVVDAIADAMKWETFEKLVREARPKYYVTQLTAPTLENDMYGTFIAKSVGARTIAFGTHITPMPRETLRPYPSLDFGLRGEPDLTLRDLIDHLEGKQFVRSDATSVLFSKHDPLYQPRELDRLSDGASDLAPIKGLAWRRGAEIVVNTDRPYIADLDDMPMPLYELLPLDKYRIPLLKGPYAFIVTSRGCPAGCTYCIKHVSYGPTMRMRSPEKLLDEIEKLVSLGVKNIHMYADLFTVNRAQVMAICAGLQARKLRVRWTCNSRVDFVDREMLGAMAASGCHYIAWGLESGNKAILTHARKGVDPERARQSLKWAHEAGIQNWGYFIIGLPGETVSSIRETIDFSKSLPLDIALFHIAAPYPGTPFFFEVVRNNWFRSDTRWEEVDMDESTVLDYPNLSAEQLEYWQKRAFREWAMRPRPIFTYLKMLAGDARTFKSAITLGLRHLGWAKG